MPIASKRLKLSVIRDMRNYWDSRQYVNSLLIYIQFIRIYGEKTPDFDLTSFTQEQIDDMIKTLFKVETLILRSRGGGKTRDGTLLFVFYNIVIGLFSWQSQASDQLNQARIWLRMNPFVEDVLQWEIRIMGCLNPAPFSMITKTRTASRRVRGIFYDELGKCKQTDIQFDFFKYSRGQMSAAKDYKIVSITTPDITSAEYYQYCYLMEEDPTNVSIHDWHYFPWITEAFIESERKKFANDKWYVQQEYECMHVVRGGAMFEPEMIKLVSEEEILSHKVNRVGLDINKNEIGIGMYVNGEKNKCYIIFERDYNWVRDKNCFNELKQPFIIHKGNKIYINSNCEIEFENGGYNEKEALSVASEIRCRVQKWTDEIKGERLSMVRGMVIYLCPKLTPNIYKDIIECVNDPMKKGIYLKDKRHPCHYLDGWLHGVGAETGLLVVAGSTRPNQLYDINPYNKETFPSF